MRVLIVPAAGKGTRFSTAGYEQPKPLIQLSTGDIMLTAAIEPFLNHVDDVSAILNNELTADQMASVTEHMRLMVNAAEIEREGEEFDLRCQRVGGQLIYQQDGGAALSVLSMQGKLHDACEVIIVNSDQVFHKEDIDAWMKHIDDVRPMGSILTFPVTDPADEKWSFVKLRESEHVGVRVVDVVAEKRKISDEATCGAYYFASWGVLRAAICSMVGAKDRTNNEFYLAPAYNYVAGEALITAFQIEGFDSLGTPELLRAWEEKQNGRVPHG